MKYKFVSIIEGSSASIPCASFREAFTHMFNCVNDLINSDKLSLQLLETAIWIEREVGSPIFFYDARDRALDEGILKDGKIKGWESYLK